MKKTLLSFLFAIGISFFTFGNGVVINMMEEDSYLKLTTSEVMVTVDQQVSITRTTQTFLNSISDSLTIKYAFPLPEGASATQLRYKINGIWYIAKFAPVPQDTSTTGGAGSPDPELNQFLGNNPLFYEIDQKILLDSTVSVELSYVELLPYKFGKVKYSYPNDYSLIQTEYLIKQELSFELNSERTIDDINLISHTPSSINNTGNNAQVEYESYESLADFNYMLEYSLSLDELGLYCLSTYIEDSLCKDEYGRGFFAFIVEPDPSENTGVIDKVFTLIIDRSGSMSGNKIVQARDAATFIIEHLNDGDKFNIVSFASDITSFRASHVEYNVANEIAALDYISAIDANGSTSISGAFDVAVPQFSISDTSVANIIIFFTDGEQTSGIINTDDLITHIDNLIVASEKDISLFTFGIGSHTNERLLTTIARNNNGLSEFLADNEVEDVITDFYLLIRNPVLLNTSITFSPSILDEVYPSQLPNLYKGQQMILVGRYQESAELTTTLSGNTFSTSVEYVYSPQLSDTAVLPYQFLIKLWAKAKIEDLLIEYYYNLNDTELSDSIKQEVIDLSMNYGVISPFTSFQGSELGGRDFNTVIIEEHLVSSPITENKFLSLLNVKPNPCYRNLKISFEIKQYVDNEISIGLINSLGELVYTDFYKISCSSVYEYEFLNIIETLETGIYYLLIEYGGETIVYRIMVY